MAKTNWYNEFRQRMNEWLMSEANMNKLPDNYSAAPGGEELLRQTDLRNHSFARFGSAAGDISSGTTGSYSQDSIMSQVVSSEIDFAIDVISKRIANFDFEVYKDTVSKELGALKSVRYVLNHRANEYSNSYQFIYKLTSQLIKYGNALAIPKYDKDNMIESMYVVDFNRVAFIKDETDHEVYVFLAKNQKQFNAYKSWYAEGMVDFDKRYINEDLEWLEGHRYKLTDVIHLKSANSHGLFGDSIYQLLWTELQHDDAVREALRTHLDNQFKIVLTGKGLGVGETTANYAAMDFDNFLSDKTRNAYTLDSVNAGITSLNPNGSIVEIMQTRQATRGLLTDKLGIPEGIFNGKGDLEHNEQLLFNNTIAPIMKQIEQELTNKLLAKNFIMKGGAIEFNTRAGAVLKFFPEKLSQVVERLTNAGTYTINAGLIELGHPQIQDPMASKILPKIQLANEAQLNIVKLQGELAAKAAKVSGATPAIGSQPTNKRPGTTTSGEPNKQFEGTGGSSSNNQNQQNIKKKSQGRL